MVLSQIIDHTKAFRWVSQRITTAASITLATEVWAISTCFATRFPTILSSVQHRRSIELIEFQRAM